MGQHKHNKSWDFASQLYARQLCNKLPTAANKMAYKNTQIEKRFPSVCSFSAGLDQRVHTEWQRPRSCVHSIMIYRKLAQAGEGGGARPPPSTVFTITYKVALHLHAPAQRTDTLTLFHLYPYVLCGLQSRSNIYSPTPITAISEDELKI